MSSNALGRQATWNPGGGRSIQIVPTIGVDSFARVGDLVSLDFQTGYGWNLIYVTPETASFRSVHSQTDDGDIWSVEIRGFSPGDSPAKAKMVADLARFPKHLVRFVDNAGLIRIAGSPTEGLSFSYELSTDEAVAGSRGYTLTLSGTLTAPPAYE